MLHMMLTQLFYTNRTTDLLIEIWGRLERIPALIDDVHQARFVAMLSQNYVKNPNVMQYQKFMWVSKI